MQPSNAVPGVSFSRHTRHGRERGRVPIRVYTVRAGDLGVTVTEVTVLTSIARTACERTEIKTEALQAARGLAQR